MYVSYSSEVAGLILPSFLYSLSWKGGSVGMVVLLIESFELILRYFGDRFCHV